MKPSRTPVIVRVFCAALTLVYFFNNVAFAHKPEANFWEERRAKIGVRNQALDIRTGVRHQALGDRTNVGLNPNSYHLSPVRLASLPANLQLPSPSSALLTTVSQGLKSPLPSAGEGERSLAVAKGEGGGEGGISSIVKALPALYGSVRNVSIPTRLRSPIRPATFGEVNDSANSRLVIHIQDVHRNPEAQANISKTIQELINQNKVGLVALEGAFQPIDFSSVRRFPYTDSVKAVADYLLKEKKISGAVYTALTSGTDIPPFVGVDQKEHYFANVEAYKKSAPYIKEYKEKYSEFRVQLIEKKKTTLNPQLLEFDEKVEAYRNGTLKVGEYVKLLVSLSPVEGEVAKPAGDSPDVWRGRVRGEAVPSSLSTFLRALNLEESLDFSQVEQERSQLLSQLVKKLDKNQISSLLTTSVAYRLGQIRHAEFYRYIQGLCKQNGINLGQSTLTRPSLTRPPATAPSPKRLWRVGDLSLKGEGRLEKNTYPAMATYIQYVLLSESLNPEKLISEMKTLEDQVYISLIKTPQEKDLISESKRLYLVGKLLDFALTPEEWGEYVQLKKLYEGIVRRDGLLEGRFQLVRSEKNKEGSDNRPKLPHDKGKRPPNDLSSRSSDLHLQLREPGLQSAFHLSNIDFQVSRGLSDFGFQLGLYLTNLGLQIGLGLSDLGFQFGFRLCDSLLEPLFSHFQNHLLRPVFNFIDYLNQRLGACIRQFFPQYLRNSNDHNSSFDPPPLKLRRGHLVEALATTDEGRTHSLPQISVPNHPLPVRERDGVRGTDFSPHPYLLPHREKELDDLSSFEAFYEEAEARDQAMVKNLLEIPLPVRERVKGEGKAKVIVLVTGGFHSHGMDEKLKDAGFTVISFAPKITHVDSDSGSAYLSVFTQEKTPLDRLFQGEKLFVSELQPPRSDVFIPPAAATAIAAEGANPRTLFRYEPLLAESKVERGEKDGARNRIKLVTSQGVFDVVAGKQVINGDEKVVVDAFSFELKGQRTSLQNTLGDHDLSKYPDLGLPAITTPNFIIAVLLIGAFSVLGHFMGAGEATMSAAPLGIFVLIAKMKSGLRIILRRLRWLLPKSEPVSPSAGAVESGLGTLSGQTPEGQPGNRELGARVGDSDIETDPFRELIVGYDLGSTALSPDGKVLATAGAYRNDIDVKLWNAGTGDLLAALKAHTDMISGLAFRPDGKVLASASIDNSARLWDVNGNLIATMPHEDPVTTLVFSPDQKVLATATFDGEVRLWNAQTGELTCLLSGRNTHVNALTFSADGQTLASAGRNGTVKLWNVETKNILQTLEAGRDAMSLAFRSDGRVIATGDWDGNIRLWDVGTGGRLADLKGHSQMVFAVAFSPDGQLLASGDAGGGQIWDANRKELLHTLTEGSYPRVFELAFSPDGRVLVTRGTTAGKDGVVHLWETASGKLLTTLWSHPNGVDFLSLHPDRKELIVGSSDGTFRWYRFGPPAPVAQAPAKPEGSASGPQPTPTPKVQEERAVSELGSQPESGPRSVTSRGPGSPIDPRIQRHIDEQRRVPTPKNPTGRPPTPSHPWAERVGDYSVEAVFEDHYDPGSLNLSSKFFTEHFDPAQADQWVFLLEAMDSSERTHKTLGTSAQLAVRIAREFGIPTFDPIANLADWKVVERTAELSIQREGQPLSRELVIGILALSMGYESGGTLSAAVLTGDDFWKGHVTEQDLLRYMNEFTRLIDTPDAGRMFDAVIALYPQAQSELTPRRMAEIFSRPETQNRSRVFIVAGLMHEAETIAGLAPLRSSTDLPQLPAPGAHQSPVFNTHILSGVVASVVGIMASQILSTSFAGLSCVVIATYLLTFLLARPEVLVHEGAHALGEGHLSWNLIDSWKVVSNSIHNQGWVNFFLGRGTTGSIDTSSDSPTRTRVAALMGLSTRILLLVAGAVLLMQGLQPPQGGSYLLLLGTQLITMSGALLLATLFWGNDFHTLMTGVAVGGSHRSGVEGAPLPMTSKEAFRILEPERQRLRRFVEGKNVFLNLRPPVQPLQELSFEAIEGNSTWTVIEEPNRLPRVVIDLNKITDSNKLEDAWWEVVRHWWEPYNRDITLAVSVNRSVTMESVDNVIASYAFPALVSFQAPADLLRQMKPLKGQKGLDIGSGWGEFTLPWAHLGADMVGIEPHPNLRESAKQNANEHRLHHGLEAQVDFQEGEAGDIARFPDNHFDFVTTRQTLYLIFKRFSSRALREASRVLKPGGRLIFFEPLPFPGENHGEEYWSFEETIQKLEEAGFHIIQSQIDPSGFVDIIAEKPLEKPEKAVVRDAVLPIEHPSTAEGHPSAPAPRAHSNFHNGLVSHDPNFQNTPPASSSGQNRREFLKSSAAVAATAVLPGVNIGQDKKPEKKEKTEGPKEKPIARELVSLVEEELKKGTLRAGEKDFEISPSFVPPHTIPTIESFFKDPLKMPETTSGWNDQLDKAQKTSEFLALAEQKISGYQSVPKKEVEKPEALSPQGTPETLKPAIDILLTGIKKAKPLLDKAVGSLSNEDRQRFLSLIDYPNEKREVQPTLPGDMVRGYDAMEKKFKQKELFEAGQIIFQAIDAAIPLLKGVRNDRRIRLKIPFGDIGDIMIGTSGDEPFNEDNLKNVALLIKPGGKSTYTAPVATAHTKEIRLVIDQSANVTVEGNENDIHGNAGSGVFGIGVMVLPNAKGTKKFRTSSFSQGAGIAGIGALFTKGKVDSIAERYIHGCGTFGAGIFVTDEADGSTVDAAMFGLGAGLTRGVGLFRHQGNNTQIKAGLVYQDPREGTTSMCLGVGYGPRAYAGGGVGIARLKGNKIEARGSHFFGGAGYWHAVGSLSIIGDNNLLQGHRYTMGSGVHDAFGYCHVVGNRNRVYSPLVGNFGWDGSLANFLMEGDENTVWMGNSFVASQGPSRSISFMKGDRNKLRIHGLGNADFQRAPAYGFHFIEGQGTKIEGLGQAPPKKEKASRLELRTGAYGVVVVEGPVEFSADLKLPELELPKASRKPRGNEAPPPGLADLLEKTKKKTPRERIADLVMIASLFVPDRTIPRKAFQELLQLSSKDDIGYLIDSVNRSAFDQYLHLLAAIPAYGELTARNIIDRWKNFSPEKRKYLLSFLQLAPPSVALPFLMKQLELEDPESKSLHGNVIQAAVGSFTGLRVPLKTLAATLADPNSKEAEGDALKLLAQLQARHAIALLGVASELTGEERAEFYSTTPTDITAPLGEVGARKFLVILKKHDSTLGRVKKELKALGDEEKNVREKIKHLLSSRNPKTPALALSALVQFQRPEDAATFKNLLNNPSARVREEAATALGRLGQAAIPQLKGALASKGRRLRELALVAISHGNAPEFVPLIEQGVKDDDPSVRLLALAVLTRFLDSLKEQKTRLFEIALKNKSQETDPSVKLKLELLESQHKLSPPKPEGKPEEEETEQATSFSNLHFMDPSASLVVSLFPEKTGPPVLAAPTQPKDPASGMGGFGSRLSLIIGATILLASGMGSMALNESAIINAIITIVAVPILLGIILLVKRLSRNAVIRLAKGVKAASAGLKVISALRSLFQWFKSRLIPEPANAVPVTDLPAPKPVVEKKSPPSPTLLPGDRIVTRRSKTVSIVLDNGEESGHIILVKRGAILPLRPSDLGFSKATLRAKRELLERRQDDRDDMTFTNDIVCAINAINFILDQIERGKATRGVFNKNALAVNARKLGKRFIKGNGGEEPSGGSATRGPLDTHKDPPPAPGTSPAPLSQGGWATPPLIQEALGKLLQIVIHQESTTAEVRTRMGNLIQELKLNYGRLSVPMLRQRVEELNQLYGGLIRSGLSEPDPISPDIALGTLIMGTLMDASEVRDLLDPAQRPSQAPDWKQLSRTYSPDTKSFDYGWIRPNRNTIRTSLPRFDYYRSPHPVIPHLTSQDQLLAERVHTALVIIDKIKNLASFKRMSAEREAGTKPEELFEDTCALMWTIAEHFGLVPIAPPSPPGASLARPSTYDWGWYFVPLLRIRYWDFEIPWKELVSRKFAPIRESLIHHLNGFLKSHDPRSPTEFRHMTHGQALIRKGMNQGRQYGMKTALYLFPVVLLSLAIFAIHPTDLSGFIALTSGLVSLLSPQVGAWIGGIQAHAKFNDIIWRKYGGVGALTMERRGKEPIKNVDDLRKRLSAQGLTEGLAVLNIIRANPNLGLDPQVLSEASRTKGKAGYQTPDQMKRGIGQLMSITQELPKDKPPSSGLTVLIAWLSKYKKGSEIDVNDVLLRLTSEGKTVFRILEKGSGVGFKLSALAQRSSISPDLASQGLANVKEVLGGFPAEAVFSKRVRNVRDAVLPTVGQESETRSQSSALPTSGSGNPVAIHVLLLGSSRSGVRSIQDKLRKNGDFNVVMRGTTARALEVLDSGQEFDVIIAIARKGDDVGFGFSRVLLNQYPRYNHRTILFADKDSTEEGIRSQAHPDVVVVQKSLNDGGSLAAAVQRAMAHPLEHPSTAEGHPSAATPKGPAPGASPEGPASSPPAAVAPVTAPVPAPQERASEQKRILFVEDDPQLRGLFKLALESAGFKVTVVENADRAVEMLEAGEKFDLIFSDVNMPGKRDGLGLYHYAREQYSPNLPVILYSGEDIDKVRKDPVAKEDKKYLATLSKPTTPAVVLGQVRLMLGLSLNHGSSKSPPATPAAPDLGASARPVPVEQFIYWLILTIPLLTFGLLSSFSVLSPPEALAASLVVGVLLLLMALIPFVPWSLPKFLNSHDSIIGSHPLFKGNTEAVDYVQEKIGTGTSVKERKRLDDLIVYIRSTTPFQRIDSYRDYLRGRYWRFGLSTFLSAHIIFGLAYWYLTVHSGLAWTAGAGLGVTLMAVLGGNLMGMLWHWVNNRWDLWKGELGASSNPPGGHPLGIPKGTPKDITQLLISARTEDAYEKAEEAFRLYQVIPDFERQPESEVPGQEVSLEILTVLLFKASQAPAEERHLWARFFCQVAPVRQSWQKQHFPGVIDFLRVFSDDPLVRAALGEIQITNGRIKEPDESLPKRVAETVLAAGSQDGSDLMPIPQVPDASRTNEFITILKPPTSLNQETIIEIVKRLKYFGYGIVGARVYSGDYFRKHPDIIGSQYREAWEGYKDGIQKAEELAEVRRIYDTDEFKTAFGTRYADSMVIPAADLAKKYALTNEQITALWETGRAAALYHNGHATGLNKVGSGRSVFPIKDTRINNGEPVIIVNGYVPSFLNLFQEPNARTVVFLVRNREDIRSPMPWGSLRKQFLGNENDPRANPAGSIRRDAWTGDLPVSPKDILNGQKNVAHLSSGPLEGMREIHVMMGYAIQDTSFGQRLLKAGYPESQIEYLMGNPMVRRLNIETRQYTSDPLFRLTEYMEPQQALVVILEYFPPFHELDPELASTVPFGEFREIQRAHQEEHLSVKKNRAAADAVKASGLKPIYFPGIPSHEMDRLKERGVSVLQAGQVAVIVPGGGTGGRFGGYDLPESHPDRQKVLAKVLEVAKGLRSALEIRAAHLLWWFQNFRAKIVALIMGNELNLPAIKQVLEEHNYFGLDRDQVEAYQQNGIYRLNPTADDLLGYPDAASLLAANGEPGEIFRDDEGHVGSKPAGQVEIIAQAVLNRRLLKLARQGVKVLATANGDDVRFLLDPAKIAHFIENPEQMMVALAWKDVTYTIQVSGQTYRLVVRGRKVVESNLPVEYQVEVGENQTLKITRDGSLVGISIKSKKVEKGGSLVDLGDRPVILEGLAFPEGMDQGQYSYFSTNQLYFKTDSLLALFNLGDLDEYERMPQKELTQRVRRTLSKLPLYVETKDVITSSENSEKPQTRKAAQVARLVGDLTRLLRTHYIVIDRDGKEGVGGYGALKEKEDAGPTSIWLEDINQRRGVFLFDPSPGKSESNPTPVVSLTVLDGNTLGPNGEINDKTKILVGVRSDETNITHPGVVSTPTQRVPKSVLDELLHSSQKTEMSNGIHLMYPEKISKAFSLQSAVYDSKVSNSHNPVVYVVQSILKGKLGLAEAVERGAVHFTATPVALLVGSVLYPKESPGTEEYSHIARHAVPVEHYGTVWLKEYHEMCNIRVVVDNPSLIPSSTPSYSELRWIEIGQFIEMARWRDTSHLSHLFTDQIRYCVQGICLLSSFAYMKFLGLVSKIVPQHPSGPQGDTDQPHSDAIGKPPDPGASEGPGRPGQRHPTVGSSMRKRHVDWNEGEIPAGQVTFTSPEKNHLGHFFQLPSKLNHALGAVVELISNHRYSSGGGLTPQDPGKPEPGLSSSGAAVGKPAEERRTGGKLKRKKSDKSFRIPADTQADLILGRVIFGKLSFSEIKDYFGDVKLDRRFDDSQFKSIADMINSMTIEEMAEQCGLSIHGLLEWEKKKRKETYGQLKSQKEAINKKSGKDKRAREKKWEERKGNVMRGEAAWISLVASLPPEVKSATPATLPTQVNPVYDQLAQQVASVVRQKAGPAGNNRLFVIAVDGETGSGKSDLVAYLNTALRSTGYRVNVLGLNQFVRVLARDGIQKKVIGLPPSDVEMKAMSRDEREISQTTSFAGEEKFWDWDMINDLFMELLDYRQKPSSKRVTIVYEAYRAQKPPRFPPSVEKRTLNIGPNDIVIVDGEYVVRPEYREEGSDVFDLTVRLKADSSRILQELEERTKRQSSENLDWLMTYFKAALASFERHAEATQHLVDFIADVETGRFVTASPGPQATPGASPGKSPGHTPDGAVLGQGTPSQTKPTRPEEDRSHPGFLGSKVNHGSEPAGGETDKQAIAFIENFNRTLVTFAQSALKDFSTLRNLADQLAVELREPWWKMIDDYEIFVTEQIGQRGLSRDLVVELLHELNIRWLTDQGLLLIPVSYWDASGELEMQIVFARLIESLGKLELMGRLVPVYLLRRFFPTDLSAAMAFFSMVGMIGVFQENPNDILRFYTLSPETIAEKGGDPSIYALIQQIGDDHIRRYADLPLASYVEDLLLEEVRHALDHARVEVKENKRFPWDDDTYGKFFIKTHLKSGGLLSRAWADFDTAVSDSDLSWLRESFARSVIEISGQMTRAATGPTPRRIFGFWLDKLLRVDRETYDGFLAAAFGIHLLAIQLQIVDPPESPLLLMNTEPRKLALLAMFINNRFTDEAIRLALKAVYSREFNYPVDEPPFSEIDFQGTVIPRASDLLSLFENLRQGDLAKPISAVSAQPPAAVAPVTAPVPAPQERASEQKRILFVEDDPQLRGFFKLALESAGFKVTVVENADQAVGVLEAGETFDLIFSDVNMPGKIDGLGLYHYVREHYPPEIPVLLYSGEDISRVQTDPTAAKDKKYLATLSKPTTPAAVLGQVRLMLGLPLNHGTSQSSPATPGPATGGPQRPGIGAVAPLSVVGLMMAGIASIFSNHQITDFFRNMKWQDVVPFFIVSAILLGFGQAGVVPYELAGLASLVVVGNGFSLKEARKLLRGTEAAQTGKAASVSPEESAKLIVQAEKDQMNLPVGHEPRVLRPEVVIGILAALQPRPIGVSSIFGTQYLTPEQKQIIQQDGWADRFLTAYGIERSRAFGELSKDSEGKLLEDVFLSGLGFVSSNSPHEVIPAGMRTDRGWVVPYTLSMQKEGVPMNDYLRKNIAQAGAEEHVVILVHSSLKGELEKVLRGIQTQARVEVFSGEVGLDENDDGGKFIVRLDRLENNGPAMNLLASRLLVVEGPKDGFEVVNGSVLKNPLKIYVEWILGQLRFVREVPVTLEQSVRSAVEALIKA